MIFDKLKAYGWNFGASATCGSGAMAAWNRGEWARGCQRISRKDEAALCEGGLE